MCKNRILSQNNITLFCHRRWPQIHVVLIGTKSKFLVAGVINSLKKLNQVVLFKDTRDGSYLRQIVQLRHYVNIFYGRAELIQQTERKKDMD